MDLRIYHSELQRSNLFRLPYRLSSLHLGGLLAMTLFLLFVILSPAYAQNDDRLLDIQKVVSSNGGITAWLVHDDSVPVIAMNFSFKGAGAAQNTADKQGLAQMLSNTLDEGAGELDSQAFQKELLDRSISLSFSSGRDDFGGSLKTLSKNKKRAFELLNLALTKPRFDQEAVDRMRQANQGRIRSSLSEPEWIAARLLNDIAFSGHPYSLNSGGTLSSLDAITPDDLRQFHMHHLGKNNLLVSVAGDIDADTLKVVLDDVFGDLPDVNIVDAEDLELQNQGTISLYENNIPQTMIEILQPGISRTNPDYHLAQIMNFILGSSGFGSRLTEEIREKRGLTYGIYTGLSNFDHLQTLSISTSTKNESVPEMLSLIHAEFEKMKNEPVSEQELADAKAYLIGSLPLSLTSTDRIAGLLSSLQADGLPIDYLDQREKAIEAASIQDISRVAQSLLDPDRFVTILVGMPEGIEDANRIETLPNVE